MDGYITYTVGAGGTWIAWHTETRPAKNATARELAAGPGPVHFAIGPTAEAAFAKLKADLSTTRTTGSAT